jgi:hypothetical protein
MSAAHTPGPWFIWKERAMQDEGLEPDDINAELLECSYFEVMAGKPIGEVSRGMIKGCNEVVELDSEDFGDNEEDGRQTALANARLIAAAPELLDALREIADDYADRFDLDSPSTNPGIKSTIANARAAIAKATGGAA